MSQPVHRPDADRNLLFGILALNMDFVSRDALVGAMQGWVLDKHKPLGQILLERGKLTAEQVLALDTLIVQHVKAHGDDPQRSLQALPAASAVRSLLAPLADDEVQTLLATIGPSDRDETDGDFSLSNRGSRYHVLRPHARGNLGEVFVAEDTELHREVALKEIRPERADEPESRGRFVLEAEITGGLEHPGIVPVYGLGAYPDGRPYYAMRLIRGESLKQMIERFHVGETQPARELGERSLAFRQLLRRFIDVCNALAYAHCRGVLHRDVKPSNVMLGYFGETLVVDWGLAKAGVRPRDKVDAGQEETRDPTLRPSSGSDLYTTRAGAILGTPLYMSPEQAGGRLDDMGPASDIYSLGSTLHVLLTGGKPFEGANAGEVMAKVARGEFTPARHVKPDTPPALDAICRKAMSLQPADRYQTALDLAADVEHWLADEAVPAYPEPWTARAGRWARRHRTTLVAAGVFLVSAVVALSVSTALVWREQRKTAQEKGLAERNYEAARMLSLHGIDLIEALEVYVAADPALHSSRMHILKTAADVCRRSLDEAPNDTELQQQAAQVYRYAANVYLLTNDTDAAEPLYQESIRLYSGLNKQSPKKVVWRHQLAWTLRDYSNLQSAVGRLEEARETLHEAIAIADQLCKEDPDPRAVSVLGATSLSLLRSPSGQGRLIVVSLLFPGRTDRSSYRRIRAVALLSLSGVERDCGRVEESGKHAREAARLFREVPAGERHPYDPLLFAAALNRAAVAERNEGRLDNARSFHQSAIKQLTDLKNVRPPKVNSIDVEHFLALCRVEESRTLAKTPQGRAKAETNLGVAILRWEELSNRYPMIPMYRESQGFAYQLRGQLRADSERWSLLAVAAATVNLVGSPLAPGPVLAASQLIAGIAKRLNEAGMDFDKSRELLEDLVKRFPRLPGNWGNLGRAYVGLTRLAPDKNEAADWLGKAADALAKAVQQSPDNVENRQSLEEVGGQRAR